MVFERLNYEVLGLVTIQDFQFADPLLLPHRSHTGPQQRELPSLDPVPSIVLARNAQIKK